MPALTIGTLSIHAQEALPDEIPIPAESELRFADLDEDPGPIEPGDEIGTFGLGDLLRMVLVLALVAGAVYGVIALLRRRIPAGDDGEDSPIRLLASRKLSAANDLHIVMIGKSVLVLGGGEGGVRNIATIEDQETIDELVLAHSQTAPAKKTFARALGEWVANFAVPGVNGAASRTGDRSGSARPTERLRHQQQRLRRL